MAKERGRAHSNRAVKIVGARQARQGHSQVPDQDTEDAAPELLADGNGIKMRTLDAASFTLDAASFSMSWHSADASISLLPPRGQYG